MLNDVALTEPDGRPARGAVYRHYKGGAYVVDLVAIDAEGPGYLIVYHPLVADETHAERWVRPLLRWDESVQWPDGVVRRRFEPCVVLPCVYKEQQHPAAHLEHWYSGVRAWCDEHVPMSGHYENCPDPCLKLRAQLPWEVAWGDPVERERLTRRGSRR